MEANTSSALLAQLLEMGFEEEQIEECQLALSTMGATVTLQSATEWLLRSSGGSSGGTSSHTPSVPTLKLGSESGATQLSGVIERPVSSGSAFDNPSGPVKSRLDFGEEKRKKKEQFMAKEREDAVKEARERRMNDMRAKALVKQQIAEDRLKRAQKTAPVASPTSKTVAAATAKRDDSAAKACRVQVRLPDGSALRHTFPPTATLSDVCRYISEQRPRLSSIQLVQPFPHKEFSSEEHQQTLESLSLCPSASLVVNRPARQQESMDTSTPVQPHPLQPYPTQPHPPQPQPPQEDEEEEEDMEEDQPIGILPHPRVRPPVPQPMWPGRAGPQPLPHPPGAYPFPGQHQQNFVEGEGHRLGGREAPMKFGDPQQLSKFVTDTARDAAEKRAKMLSKMSSEDKIHRIHALNFPTLEVLSLRALARWSSVHRLPSCSQLPPRTAHRLIAALAKEKQLHPKTLTAFIKCPLQVLKLDNYSYATNQLLDMARYFPTLTHLSLVSCTLLTDKCITQLLPYLSNLVYLNLNGCRQLSDVIFQSFKGYNKLEELHLSQLKLTDTGVRLFLRHPLPSLRELDLSYTGVTEAFLLLLPEGTPNIESLNIEATKVTNVDPLLSLGSLTSLNVSQCQLKDQIGSLAACRALTSLSLSQIHVDCDMLQLLAGLPLLTLGLPDRNFFFDEHMGIVSGFPLTSLNLTGYCNITDIGIQHIAQIKTLTQLSLSRTRLTDEGMVYLSDLTDLKELSLDNTLITDAGMSCIAGLINLEDLSVSDTKLTDQFIINGALTQLRKLKKLNLVRTFVEDEGLSKLCLPYLIMLNIDWTCAVNTTLESLRASGCRCLETLRCSNIGQPTAKELEQLRQQAAQQPPPPANNYYYDDDDASEGDDMEDY